MWRHIEDTGKQRLLLSVNIVTTDMLIWSGIWPHVHLIQGIRWRARNLFVLIVMHNMLNWSTLIIMKRRPVRRGLSDFWIVWTFIFCKLVSVYLFFIIDCSKLVQLLKVDGTWFGLMIQYIQSMRDVWKVDHTWVWVYRALFYILGCLLNCWAVKYYFYMQNFIFVKVGGCP